MALPFTDGAFDMVTCQTVLIHIAEPKAAFKEMMRSTKPGGLVLTVEPCHMGSMGFFSSMTDTFPIDVVAATLGFHLCFSEESVRWERGLTPWEIWYRG